MKEFDLVDASKRSATRGNAGRPRTALIAFITALVVALLGLNVAAPAQAATVHVGSGAVTIYLTKAETRAMGNGRIPAPPAATPWQLKAVYYAVAYGHVWIARQYANAGWCSGFTLNIRPWASQGYFGYRC